MPTVRVSGATISYVRSGDGPGVLFIQGVGVVGEGWRPQVDALSRHFTCISFDNRGIGASLLEDGALSIDAMAGDAIAIMDAEGIDRFHVVGHSMGGVIAQAVALQAPTRVRTLSLLCTFARGRDATALSWPMLVMGLRTRIGTRAMRRRTPSRPACAKRCTPSRLVAKPNAAVAKQRCFWRQNVRAFSAPRCTPNPWSSKRPPSNVAPPR